MVTFLGCDDQLAAGAALSTPNQDGASVLLYMDGGLPGVRSESRK